MNRSLKSVAALFVCLLTSTAAEGQIVRVGGGGGVRVRAPFVSVDVLPFRGGTRVRAPFTSVRTRAYRYGYGPYYAAPYAVYPAPVYVQPYANPQPVYVEPTYGDPVAVQPATAPVDGSSQANRDSRRAASRPALQGPADRDAIAARLAAAADRLTRSLRLRRDDADVWLDYLRPEQIADTAESGQSPESVAPLLRNYEGITGNSSLASVWSAAGFRETYDLLRQYVSTSEIGATSPRPEDDRPRPDDNLRPAELPIPPAREPKVAKPISPANDDTADQVDPEPADDQGEEQSLLLPPR